MKALKKGWVEGTVKELLSLSDEDSAHIEKKLAAKRTAEEKKPGGMIHLEGHDPAPMEFMRWKDGESTEFFARVGADIKKVRLSPVIPLGCMGFAYNGSKTAHPFGLLNVSSVTPCKLTAPCVMQQSIFDGLFGGDELQQREYARKHGEILIIPDPPLTENVQSKTKRTASSKRKKGARPYSAEEEARRIQKYVDAETKRSLGIWLEQNNIDEAAMLAEYNAFFIWVRENVLLDEFVMRNEYSSSEAGHVVALAAMVRFKVRFSDGNISYAAGCDLLNQAASEWREISDGKEITPAAEKRIISSVGALLEKRQTLGREVAARNKKDKRDESVHIIGSVYESLIAANRLNRESEIHKSGKTKIEDMSSWAASRIASEVENGLAAEYRNKRGFIGGTLRKKLSEYMKIKNPPQKE